ncbi:MAG: hypothetical protein Q9228_008063, partial [Teloschistes exilis]
MVVEANLSDPQDPLNEAFRGHFSTKDSTLSNLFAILNKPLLYFLQQSLAEVHGNSSTMASVETEIFDSRPSIFTKMLHADSIQSGLADNIRHFLQKCLRDPTWILGSRQSRLRRNDTTKKAMIQLENAEGQSLASIFKLRFIKLVWYRAFVGHAISQGKLAWPIATGDLYALMPDLSTKYLDQFLRSFVPFADIPTTQRIQALVLAGLRYDYLCYGEYHGSNRLPNERNLFLLPDS